MTSLLRQTFDNGAPGADIDWNTTEAAGTPLWLAGDGAAKYTTPGIHGSTAAKVTTNAGANMAALIANMPAGVKELRCHTYVIAPTLPAGAHVAVLSMAAPNDDASVILSGDGGITGTCWHGDLAPWSPAATFKAGDTLRVSARLLIGASVTTAWLAVFKGESTTSLWSATATVADIAPADAISNVQFGVVNLSGSTAAASVTMDTVAVEHGAGSSAAFLPPEVAPPPKRRNQVWIRTATGWRNIGTGTIR